MLRREKKVDRNIYTNGVSTRTSIYSTENCVTILLKHLFHEGYSPNDLYIAFVECWNESSQNVVYN